jgi:FKBP-type peptidyl-prolyl cis-trans isomerase FkpA
MRHQASKPAFIAICLATAFAASVAAVPASAQTEKAAANKPADTPRKQTMSNGLVIEDSKIGTGATAAAGANVVVHYTGWLYDESAPAHHGKKFDSSVDRNEPFTFPLGAGRVIKGWDQGVAGMLVGGKRTLTIPPALGYGERGAGGGVIPPNATLIFDVELLDVKS